VSTEAARSEPVRLGVLAALVEADEATMPPGPANAEERRLADAMRGEPGGGPGPDAPALAELLRLADGAPTADAFIVGLRQAFLIPDDSQPPPAREACADACADVYRRLALPGLASEPMMRAQAILQRLTTPY